MGAAEDGSGTQPALQVDPARVGAQLAQFGLVPLDICTGPEAEMAELLERWLLARADESTAATEVPDDVPELAPGSLAPSLPPCPGGPAPGSPLELDRPAPTFWRGIPVQDPAEPPTGRYRLPRRPAAPPSG